MTNKIEKLNAEFKTDQNGEKTLFFRSRINIPHSSRLSIYESMEIICDKIDELIDAQNKDCETLHLMCEEW